MELGRLFIIAGAVLLCLGLVAVALGRMHIPLGRLPGDVIWRKGTSTVYLPIVTCLLLSVLGSMVLWLFSRK